MSGSWPPGNRKIQNMPYRAGCQPAANEMTWIVTSGCPAAWIRCPIWSRRTRRTPMGRRGTVSSRTTWYRVGPQRHGAFGEVAAGGGEAGGGDGPDVTLGLQEPGDDLGFAGADEGGGFLEADGGAEPGGQDVVVAVPPAGCAALAGQGEERVDLAAVGDAVGHQQALDGQGLEAALGAFHPADGPFGGADGIPGLLVAHPGFLAQGLELAGQDHAQHGGARAVGGGHRFLPCRCSRRQGATVSAAAQYAPWRGVGRCLCLCSRSFLVLLFAPATVSTRSFPLSGAVL